LRRRTQALACVLADAEPAITAIMRRRGGQRTRAEFGGGARVFVSEFGDDGVQGSVLGEELSFAGLEFADSAVGLVE
jgi:hypothetical protein